jgi:alkylhydroperoxidase family enzyme
MPNFSRITVVEAISYLDSMSHAEMDRLLLRYGLEQVAPFSLGSKNARLNALMRYLIDHPDERCSTGALLTFELIQLVIRRLNQSVTIVEDHPELTNALRQDGYIIRDGELQSVLPEDIHLPEQVNLLDSLLNKYGFAVAAGHLEQAKMHT